MARSAQRAAAIHLEQALDAVRHWPEGQHTLETAVDLQLELVNALVPLGAFDQQAECLRQAATLAETLGDRHRLGVALARLGHISFAVGDQVTAIASTQRALAIAQAEGDGWVEGVAIFYLGRFDHLRGDYRRATELIRAFLARVHNQR
jgi:tetratricopeptide (TPR) repeat protein